MGVNDEEIFQNELRSTLRHLDDELDGIQAGRKLDNTKKVSQLATGDAYRNTAILVSMVGDGRVSSLEQFQGSRVLQGSRKGWLQDLSGYLSLYMSEEPVTNADLRAETDRARTVAEELHHRGTTNEKWQTANERFQLLLSNRSSVPSQ